ncbi:MAG: hypothetical protein U1C48_01530 [Methylotenera sp.]|nr:hypothetical protein [Methylotenera sp.]
MFIHFNTYTAIGICTTLDIEEFQQEMSYIPTQRWRIAPPKTISVKVFKSLIQSLDNFMPGLKTIRRSTRAKVIALGQVNVLEGKDSWEVYQPYAFDKIEHLQFEMTLHKSNEASCELHVEFCKNHVLLSVSDIETGWRDAVFDEIERTLKIQGLFKGEWVNKLTSTFIRLQNVFLVLGASLLLLTHTDGYIDFKYFSLSLLVTGLIPVITDIFRLYFPAKPIDVLEERLTTPTTPSRIVEKFAIWVGITSNVVTLIIGLSSFIGGNF